MVAKSHRLSFTGKCLWFVISISSICLCQIASAGFGYTEGSPGSPSSELTRETRFLTKQARVVTAARSGQLSTLSFGQGVSQYAGTYSGGYTLVGGNEGFANITVRFDDAGNLVDLFGSGGPNGFGRPASFSGSVDSSGNVYFTTFFDSARQETGYWIGNIRGSSISGTVDLTYGNGDPDRSGTWSFSKGLDNKEILPESLWGDPVDTSSGAYILWATPLRLNCPAGLEFTIEYNSGLLYLGPLGVGWGHNFEMRVDELNGGQDVIFNWNQNRRNYFTRSAGSSVYTSVDLAMRFDTITKNGDGTYTLLRPDQSKMQFNTAGRLIQFENKYGQKTNLTYNSAGDKLQSVQEAISGKAFSFGYDSSGRLALVVDSLGRRLTFGYNNSSDTMSYWLLSNSSNVGVSANIFSYDTRGRILTATDGEGVVFVSNTYDSIGRVIAQDDALPDTPLTKFSYDDISSPGEIITTVTDRNRKKTVYTHDSLYRLIGLTNQNGETTAYTYDSDGNRLSMTDPLGRTTQFTYDAHGNLLTTTDPSNAVTSMVYDAKNNLTKITNAAGKETNFTYDGKNNLLTVVNALNQTVTTAYDANSLPQQRIAARGGMTTYTYTAGLATSVKDPNNNTTTMGYDAAGRLTSTTDPLSKTTTFTYRADDYLLSTTDPLSHSVSFTYDSRGRKLTEVDPLGNITSFSYDGNGNLRTRTDALGNTSTFLYDGEDRLIRTIDPRGGISQMRYDPAGRLVTIINPVGHAQNFRYDAAGNLIDLVDARGNRTRSTLDNRYLATSIEDPHNRTSTASFDNLRRLTGTANALGELTQLAYDDLDRLVSTIDPLGQVSSQAYDADGNRISLTNPRNASTTFSYDLAGRMNSVTVPGGRTTSYTYDARNLPLTITEPSSQQTTLSYDDAGRLTQSTDPTGTISYTYDDAGRVLTVTEGGATIRRVYDALGRLTQFTDGEGNVLKYAYDAASNLTALTYPDNKTVTYGYDAANRLISVTDWASRVTSYTYDPDGNLAITTRPNGTVETRTWLPTGELATLTDTAGATVISQFTYTYDPAGRIISEDPQPAPADFTPSTFTATYDLGNRLTTFNSNPVTHDADGNMTFGPNGNGIGFGSYTYDSRNRLTSHGGVTYTYDAENRRTSLTDGSVTTNYVTNPNAALTQVLVRTNSLGVITRSVYGIGLIYEETETTSRYYHYDSRGSSIAFTNSVGNLLGRVTYDSYGEVSSLTGDTATPYLFIARSGVMTDINGLHNMRARYYHPTTRRFVNQDVLVGLIENSVSLNRFAYANNDPVNFVDPSGYFGLPGAVVGAVLGIGFQAVSDLIVGERSSWQTYAGSAVAGGLAGGTPITAVGYLGQLVPRIGVNAFGSGFGNAFEQGVTYIRSDGQILPDFNAFRASFGFGALSGFLPDLPVLGITKKNLNPNSIFSTVQMVETKIARGQIGGYLSLRAETIAKIIKQKVASSLIGGVYGVLIDSNRRLWTEYHGLVSQGHDIEAQLLLQKEIFNTGKLDTAEGKKL